MSEGVSSNDADLSDYKFWRSQHRPQAGTANEKVSKGDVLLEAMYNRFGEELGQSLHGIVWPVVPGRLKKTVGLCAGKFGPIALVMAKAWSLGTHLLDRNQVRKAVMQSIQLNLDGRKSRIALHDWPDLYDAMGMAKEYWTLCLQWSPEDRIRYDHGESFKDGLFEQEACGQVVSTLKGISTMQRHNMVYDFIRKTVAERLIVELSIDCNAPISDMTLEDKAKVDCLVSCMDQLR
jgi:hypothetical protein